MSITVPRLLCVLLYTNILINAENTTSNDQDERFHWKIPKRPHIIFILADDMVKINKYTYYTNNIILILGLE